MVTGAIEEKNSSKHNTGAITAQCYECSGKKTANSS